jgi:hypothetical protein
MFNKSTIALSVAIAFSTMSGAFANNSSEYSSPDSTPNGPFLYADTHGVPPTVLRALHPSRHPSRKH